jgi:hypothetical protein
MLPFGVVVVKGVVQQYISCLGNAHTVVRYIVRVSYEFGTCLLFQIMEMYNYIKRLGPINTFSCFYLNQGNIRKSGGTAAAPSTQPVHYTIPIE